MDEIAEIIAARRTEIEAEFRETWAAIPMAKTVYTAALRAHEDAQARYNTVVARIDRAANHTDPLSAVLRELLATERERYNEAGAALTKAKRHVADLSGSRNAGEAILSSSTGSSIRQSRRHIWRS